MGVFKQAQKLAHAGKFCLSWAKISTNKATIFLWSCFNLKESVIFRDSLDASFFSVQSGS